MTNRYSLFKKATLAKTGTIKSIRKARTRAEARAHKDGDTSIGIWDNVRNVAVR